LGFVYEWGMGDSGAVRFKGGTLHTSLKKKAKTRKRGGVQAKGSAAVN